MNHTGTVLPELAHNSILAEISRDFWVTLRTAKRLLGLRHPLVTACLHASQFPSDRMSYKLVWSEFNALTITQRNELLQALRNQHRKR